MQKTFNLLDIDLDFFVNEIFFDAKTDSTARVTGETYQPWSIDQTIEFLEHHCLLNPKQKIKGAYFVHHHSVFDYLREIVLEHKNDEVQFNIDHIDGHADLGSGDEGYLYICSELIHRPVKQRYYPQPHDHYQSLSPGNFLAYALACRWVKSLNYIIHPDKGNDVVSIHCKDYEDKSGFLQLKGFSKTHLDEMNKIFDGLPYEKALAVLKKQIPLFLEPQVPFKMIPYDEFFASDSYDYICITQSPAFTPKASDELIPLIMKYIEIHTEIPLIP